MYLCLLLFKLFSELSKIGLVLLFLIKPTNNGKFVIPYCIIFHSFIFCLLYLWIRCMCLPDCLLPCLLDMCFLAATVEHFFSSLCFCFFFFFSSVGTLLFWWMFIFCLKAPVKTPAGFQIMRKRYNKYQFYFKSLWLQGKCWIALNCSDFFSVMRILLVIPNCQRLLWDP